MKGISVNSVASVAVLFSRLARDFGVEGPEDSRTD
jgi:hypothetical protein